MLWVTFLGQDCQKFSLNLASFLRGMWDRITHQFLTNPVSKDANPVRAATHCKGSGHYCSAWIALKKKKVKGKSSFPKK